MTRRPQVSVVIIFLDEERFLDEAIRSVLDQTVNDWELLLIDDGSTDGSSAIARGWAAADPRMRYAHHPGRENRGMSTSRNLGLQLARGELIAFLDADDVWLPRKLDVQLADMAVNPDAAMTYGPILRWHGWTGADDAHLHEDLCGVGPRKRGSHPFSGETVAPPNLVPLIIGSDYYCPAGGLIRTAALRAVGGFEDRFRSLHEDGVAMVKLCARYPVHVAPEVTYLYRMHPESCTQQVTSAITALRARRRFVDWADAHLSSTDAHTRASTRAVHVARARLALRERQRELGLHPARALVRLGRRTGRAVLPRSVRDRWRARWFAHRRPDLDDLGVTSQRSRPAMQRSRDAGA